MLNVICWLQAVCLPLAKIVVLFSNQHTWLIIDWEAGRLLDTYYRYQPSRADPGDCIN
jgi:hypothetical protein